MSLPVRRALVAAASVLVLSACGTSGPSADPTDDPSAAATTDEPTDADRACRDRWQEATTDVELGIAVARAFRSRFDSLNANAAYYATNAVEKDCGELLTGQQEDVKAFDALVVSLRPYDFTRRAAVATQAAKAKKKLPAAARKQVSALTRAAVPADQALVPAMQSLAALDPADADAVKKGKADLDLLASASDPVRAARSALTALGKAGISA